MVGHSPSALLVEPGAPPWGQRLGLRLSQNFQSLYPQQPTRLWDAGTVADLPPASDWPGGVVVADGGVWISDGTSWVKLGPATDAPTPPQFDNDASIATTAWVTRFGRSFSSTLTVAANTALTAAVAGGLVVINTNNAVINLPSPAGFRLGTTIDFMSAGVNNVVQRTGAALIFLAGTGLTSLALGPWDTVTLETDGGNWLVVGGSVLTKFQPQFATHIGDPASQKFPGGLITNFGFTNVATANVATVVDFPTPFPNGQLSIMATVYGGANIGKMWSVMTQTQGFLYSDTGNTNCCWQAWGY